MCHITYTFLVFLREDLTNLPYLTMVIKETMRFHSPVHFFHRVLSKDTVIDGKIAPAGTAVSCELYNLHHNPLLWPNSMVKVQARTLSFTRTTCITTLSSEQTLWYKSKTVSYTRTTCITTLSSGQTLW